MSGEAGPRRTGGGLQANVPPVLLQFGQIRTASTLQFQALCVVLMLIDPQRADEVRCEYLAYNGGCSSNKAGPTLLNVTAHRARALFKTHHPRCPRQISELAKAKHLARPWIFASAANSSSLGSEGSFDVAGTTQAVESQLRARVEYVQLSSMLAWRGVGLLTDLQPIFRLSNAQLSHLLEYMRLYSLLRQCCGPEASKTWRALGQRRSGTWGNAAAPHGATPHLCSVYNLDALEAALLHTHIHEQFGHTRPVRAPHGIGELNGTLCSRSNRAMQQYCSLPKRERMRTNLSVRDQRACV